jgi:hypothetical protein
MARRRRRGGAALNQALLEADVRYSPAAFALSQLLRDAHSTYLTQLQGERASAAGISKAAKAAIPGMRKVYGTAQATRQAANDLVTPKLAGLTGSDDIKAALASESAAPAGRNAEAGASAESELRNRAVDAVVSGKRGEQAARTQYVTDKGRIGQQLLDLASQKGAFTAATLGSVKQAQRQARVTIRGQNLTHQDRQATNKRETRKDTYQRTHHLGPYKPASPGKGTNTGPTRTQRVAAHDKYDRGVNIAQQLRKGGKDSKGKRVPPATEGEIVQILTEKLGSAVLAKAAAQTVFYRGVGPNTRRRAKHRYGINLPGFPKRRPAPKSQPGLRGLAGVSG